MHSAVSTSCHISMARSPNPRSTGPGTPLEVVSAGGALQEIRPRLPGQNTQLTGGASGCKAWPRRRHCANQAQRAPHPRIT
jgi:hypothetical protein